MSRGFSGRTIRGGNVRAEGLKMALEEQIAYMWEIPKSVEKVVENAFRSPKSVEKWPQNVRGT